jgi:ABC-type molybdenum transport system ATPase subunit/photorepair protein PhrA
MIQFDRATVARAGHVVVEELSLRVLPGQSTALIGRSGAGKSATLAAAACMLPQREWRCGAGRRAPG